MDDAFAKSVGNYETVAALHEEIKQTLTEQFESEQLSEYDSQIIDLLIEKSNIKYPPQMLEDEIDDFIHDLEHQLSHQGLTIDLYLKSRSIEMEGLREEVKENAESRMKRGLILMEVANDAKITIPTEEINERVQKTIQEVAAYYSEEEANRLGSGANLENLRSRIATDEIISRTLKKLRDIAMGKAEEELAEAEAETVAETDAEKAAETEAEEISEDSANESDPAEEALEESAAAEAADSEETEK